MKLISCNIEGHRHLADRVIPFLKQEKPDVVCLQEVFKVDMPRLQEVLGMDGEYRGMAKVAETSVHQKDALGDWGVAVFSRLDNPQYQANYYVKKPDEIPIFFQNNDPNNMHRIVLSVSGQHQGSEYTFATTHFTWSMEGQFTQEQAQAYSSMEEVLAKLSPHVLCGDFNSPRIWQDEQQAQYEQNVFGKLAAKYQDNIPQDVTTTIDGNLHKAGNLQLTVDGLFSSPEYAVSQVRVVDGVSDHQALVATVEVITPANHLTK
jgi:endonuclease/exonuclease/phosphatase family metal-dependent hydrolase